MRLRDGLAYTVSIGLSWGLHVLVLDGLGNAARQAPHRRAPPIEMAVIAPPPPPLELQKAKPPPPPPPPRVRRPPPPPTVKPVALPPSDAPPPTEPPKEPAKPVFGISMTSTVGDSSFSVRVGNTVMKGPDEGGLAQPYATVSSYDLTRMPKRLGECVAIYPSEAKHLGIEGRVTLDVEVRDDGTVGEVRLISGIGHGLDEAAMAALKKCHFSPGELDGRQVATRIEYVYTFLLED